MLLLLFSPLIFAQQCNLSLNRLVGRTNSYVYACNCPQPSGRLGPVARAEALIPPSQPDTAARAAATIRCILQEEARLLQICEQDTRRYDVVATQTLNTCLSADITPQEAQLEGPFTFSKQRCEAGLSTFLGAQIAGVYLCICRGDGFDVVVGRADFVIESSPLSDELEVELIRECEQQFQSQVQDVCVNSPADFEILALQLLQVCCKRIRVGLDAKFECDSIVPDDLSAFKVAIP